MIDIRAELKEKKNEVISLHEVILTIKEQSPGATLPDIAEWLLIHLNNDPNAPEMGLLTVGGGYESIAPQWGQPTLNSPYTLEELLIELYKSYDLWPGEIPF